MKTHWLDNDENLSQYLALALRDVDLLFNVVNRVMSTEGFSALNPNHSKKENPNARSTSNSQ